MLINIKSNYVLVYVYLEVIDILKFLFAFRSCLAFLCDHFASMHGSIPSIAVSTIKLIPKLNVQTIVCVLKCYRNPCILNRKCLKCMRVCMNLSFSIGMVSYGYPPILYHLFALADCIFFFSFSIDNTMLYFA